MCVVKRFFSISVGSAGHIVHHLFVLLLFYLITICINDDTLIFTQSSCCVAMAALIPQVHDAWSAGIWESFRIPNQPDKLPVGRR